MIRFLKDVRIERKLMLVVLLSCMIALLVAGAVQTAFQLLSSRRTFIRDLSTLAEVIASNTTGAVAFKDQRSAVEVLAALRANPAVLSASVWLPDGVALARFGRPEDIPPDEFGKGATPEVVVDGLQIRHYQPVILDGRQIGLVYTHSNFGPELIRACRVELSTLAGAMAVSMILALLISKRLQTLISKPIQKLAETAAEIARRKDYSLRAKKFEEDEVGSFTDAFNDMLDEIQRQDGTLRHEIAERLRAEQEVDALHKQVLSTSRQAGMAEVATGVLHNVGNVLNSVNISTALVTEEIKKSRVQHLSQLAELLRGQAPAFGKFVTEDPRGRALPEYITELAQRLEAERTRMQHEIRTVSENIEHIKEIVSMQQSYAKVHGVIETLPLVDVVEDALRMNAAAFARHTVSVQRDFADISSVSVDRHKVLQILTNILRNAKYATDESHRTPKLVQIEIRPDPEGFALVIVRDNGVGIPREYLTRIFNHGFTTREDGHGFGLHSGALAAKEMGGYLKAESDGPGMGATFTLALPMAIASPSVENPEQKPESVCQTL